MSNVHILKQKPDIAKYYDDLIEKYGASFQSADASSQEALEARWKVLAEVGDLTSKSVLDVGCGWGYGAKYLSNKMLLADYTGIDISRKMIEQAKALYPDINFIHADLTAYEPKKKFDIVIAQGIFYKLSVNNDGYAKVFELIKHMVRLAKEAIAFTGVSVIPWGHSNKELRIEPHSMLNYLSTFSPFITMKTDYWLGDSCWYLYKEKQ